MMTKKHGKSAILLSLIILPVSLLLMKYLEGPIAGATLWIGGGLFIYGVGVYLISTFHNRNSS